MCTVLPETPLAPAFTPASDADAAARFAERFVRALNEAALVQMASVGHRTGLFDAMADGRARTSPELAAVAGLQERYVREWLAAMTVAEVVAYDPATARYALPAAHAALLTRAAPVNLAVPAQFLPVLGGVEDDVVRCFREGGGVPYERFGRFHEVMAEQSGQLVVAPLAEHVLPLVPGLTERLEAGIRVLDLGCGRGRALLALAERFPASTFRGYDLCADTVAHAQDAARARGLTNVHFMERDLADFDETASPETYDLVTTFDAVHDQPRPGALLRGIARTLRPGGAYLMQEIRGSSHLHRNLGHPFGALNYAVSCMHCMTVSLAQGGEGLGNMWGRERAEAMLREAGFGEVAVHELPGDTANDYYVARRGADAG